MKPGNYRFFIFTMLFILCSGLLFAQEPILFSYQRNFVRASLASKINIIRDAATDSRSEEFIGNLYDFALKFVLDNSELLRNDADLVTLTGTVARGIKNSGLIELADTLWTVFLTYQDPYSRIEILETLSSFGRDQRFIDNLNHFIISHNRAYRNGLTLDYTTFSECISILGAMGDPSSFFPLFDSLVTGYPQRINNEVQKVLESLDGNYRLLLSDIIENNPPSEKLAALRLGVQGDKLSQNEQALLSQLALGIGLDYELGEGESERDLNTLRYSSIQVITKLKWTRASPLAIRHFYKVQSDYRIDAASRARFLEAIICLGAMGTSESAQALALQLGYFNSRIGLTEEYDNEIVMALVKALGEIGDKSAFDYLLQVSFLNYPDQILAAARDAMNRLTW